MEFSLGSNVHTPQTHPLISPQQAREDKHCGLHKPRARVPSSGCVGVSPSTESRTALNTSRWPSTRTTHSQPTPLSPSDSREVTQHGSWPVMEPVSHPSSINLTSHSSTSLEPPPSSDQLAQGERWGGGSRREGRG